MKVEDAVIALGALAQDSRLAIYRLLVKRGPDGYSPTDLVEKIDIPAPTLSFHLKELQRAGLIASRREGRFLYYSANFERMRGLIGFLTEKCCSLSDTECDSACVPVPAMIRQRRA
jgi:ArsR family transcriptional regulator